MKFSGIVCVFRLVVEKSHNHSLNSPFFLFYHHIYGSGFVSSFTQSKKILKPIWNKLMIIKVIVELKSISVSLSRDSEMESEKKRYREREGGERKMKKEKEKRKIFQVFNWWFLYNVMRTRFFAIIFFFSVFRCLLKVNKPLWLLLLNGVTDAMHEIRGVLNNFDWIHSTNFIDRCDNEKCTCCAENCIDFRFSHYYRLPAKPCYENANDRSTCRCIAKHFEWTGKQQSISGCCALIIIIIVLALVLVQMWKKVRMKERKTNKSRTEFEFILGDRPYSIGSKHIQGSISWNWLWQSNIFFGELKLKHTLWKRFENASPHYLRIKVANTLLEKEWSIKCLVLWLT